MPGTRVLAALVAMAALWACAAPAVAAGPGTTSLLSRPSGLGSLPVAGDGGSGAGTEAMSGDGRFVVFLSGADDLGVRDTSFHVWVRDTAFDTNRLVDRAPGGEPANGFAQRASISRDGSTVCFLSNATNLVPGVSGGHVYVVTLSSGAVTVADRADTAVGAVGNDVPLGCALDATGAHVAFESRATNLVSGDTNSQGDVFVRDLAASTTERVSVDSGEAQAAQRSEGGAITADGLKVAFISQSPLVAGDTNEVQDVFLRDIAAGTTTRVSVATGSIQANGHSFSPSISDDGTTVAFASDADNLHLAPDTNDKRDVFVRLIGSDTTVAVSRADGPVGALGDGDSDNPAISGNGGGVAFDSEATNLGAGAPPPGVRRRVYLRQVGGDQHTLLLSRASGAAGAPSDGFAVLPSLPTTPTAAAWLDFGGNLDPAASGEFGGVFKRELSGGEPTILVSRPNGTGPRSSAVNTAFVAGPRAVSADGRRVVIVSHSDSLDPAGAGRFQHIYVRDTLTQTTTLVDRGSGPDAAAGNAGAQQASISADGRRVAFISEATNLLPGGNPPGAFVRDLETNELFLVSRQDGAAGAPLDLQISGGMEPAMNSDGTRVAFVSDLKPVGPADTNTDQDVHVRDLVAGTTTLVSVGPTGVGNSRSTNPAMSADGTRVAFQSNSSNLVGEPVTPGAHIYVRDLGAGTTVLADRSSADGAPGTGQAIAPGISADGTRVMFTALQPLTPEALPAPGRAIYVRDLTTQTTILATKSPTKRPPGVEPGLRRWQRRVLPS